MHLLVIFVIAVLVFGPKKLPELGKSIGEGIRALTMRMHFLWLAAEHRERTDSICICR